MLNSTHCYIQPTAHHNFYLQLSDHYESLSPSPPPQVGPSRIQTKPNPNQTKSKPNQILTKPNPNQTKPNPNQTKS